MGNIRTQGIRSAAEMTHQLTTTQEKLLADITRRRGFRSADDALTAVLEAAAEETADDLDEIRSELRLGFDQRARGEFVEYTEEWRANQLRKVLEQSGATKATA